MESRIIEVGNHKVDEDYHRHTKANPLGAATPRGFFCAYCPLPRLSSHLQM